MTTLEQAAKMMEAEGFQAAPEVLAAVLKKGFRLVWIAEKYTYMYIVMGHQGYVCNFVVHKDHRHEGLGPKIAKRIFRQMKDRGVTHLYIEVNRRGWLRLGFRMLGHGNWAVKEL